MKLKQAISRLNPMRIVPTGPIQWGLALAQVGLVVLAVWMGTSRFRPQADGDLASVTQSRAGGNEATLLQEESSGPQPLKAYSPITDRNLFNTSEGANAADRPSVSLDSVKQAPENFELNLVGTMVLGPFAKSMAVIENRRTGKQDTVREGDVTDNVRIKRVLRSKIVVVTAQGEMMLAMEAGPGKGGAVGVSDTAVATAPEKAPGDEQFTVEIAAAIENPPPQKQVKYRINRAQTLALLSDPEEMKKVNFVSESGGDGTAGYRIENLTYQNAISKLGVVSSDIITRINGEAFTRPDQVSEAVQRLERGEELVIEMLRSGEPWKVNVNAG